MNTNSKLTSSSKKHNIIQWNCRGIKQNFNELFILISLLNPATICLQETFQKENHNLKTLNYEQYHNIHNTGHRANGGTSILVRNDIQGSLNKFPDFFRMGTFIESTHPFEVISSGCNALIVPFQQLLEGPIEVLLCEHVSDLCHSLFHLLNCLIMTASKFFLELRE